MAEKRFLTRIEAAEHLNAMGLPMSKATLQKLACVGGGPVYAIFGNRALYKQSELETWAMSRIGPSGTSTTEIEAKL